mmetsp:Transcript_29326/g.58199  ORF Transcript_29326/g.58199 Transcript_29326/m.58199 type:complete len:270 (+) Transcript_29326:574-1383(+)
MRHHGGAGRPLPIAGELPGDPRAPAPRDAAGGRRRARAGALRRAGAGAGAHLRAGLRGGRLLRAQLLPGGGGGVAPEGVREHGRQIRRTARRGVAPGARQRHRGGGVVRAGHHRGNAERGRRAGADGAAAPALDAGARRRGAVRGGDRRAAVCQPGGLEAEQEGAGGARGAGAAGGERVERGGAEAAGGDGRRWAPVDTAICGSLVGRYGAPTVARGREGCCCHVGLGAYYRPRKYLTGGDEVIRGCLVMLSKEYRLEKTHSKVQPSRH